MGTFDICPGDQFDIKNLLNIGKLNQVVMYNVGPEIYKAGMFIGDDIIYNNTTQSYSHGSNIAVGNGIRLSDKNQVVIGDYNVDLGVNSIVVANGVDDANRNNAIEITTDYIKLKTTYAVLERADTTTNRPGSPRIGQFYFDTDLGLPIWYDGAQWIDAAGNAV